MTSKTVGYLLHRTDYKTGSFFTMTRKRAQGLIACPSFFEFCVSSYEIDDIYGLLEFFAEAHKVFLKIIDVLYENIFESKEIELAYFIIKYIFRVYIKIMKQTGDIWEILAIEYLQKKGYHIRDTNFKFGRFWEIDIIANLEGRVIFFEVKYRSHLGCWYPEESIIPAKLRKCLLTMQYYCVKHKISLQNIQFDVIAILKQESSHRVTHYKNIEL